MEHISEIDLLEYVGGRLKASKHQQVQEHIEHCALCSKRYQEAAQMWNTLGQWSVDTAEHDVAGRITALAEKTERSQRQLEKAKAHVLRARLLPVVLRVAASIIIAIGVGHELGKYSVTWNKPRATASKNRPEYLAALGLEWTSELAWLILEDDSSDMGEEQ